MSTTVARAPAGEQSSTVITATSNVRWTLVAPTLLVIWIISMFDKANMSIVQNNPRFLDDFGLNGQQAKIGLLSTGLFLAYAICAPLWGYLVGAIGARKTAALSLLVWAVTCFWSGLAQSYNSLLFSRIALGFGEAALYPFTLALVSHWFALKERGRATSFWWIGTMIGPMIMGLVVTFLIVTFGWRYQFHAMGLLALFVPLPMVWFLVRDKPGQHPAVDPTEVALISGGTLQKNEDAPGHTRRAENRVWWKNYRFWLVTVAIGTNSVFYWGWSIWLPTYLRTSRGFSFQTSGYLTFVIFGFAVATILVIGHYSDRIFRRAPLAGIGWICAAALLVASALAPSPILSVIFSIAALCAQQVGISCAEMLMHSIVPESEMGPSQGMRAITAQLIGASSPWLIGVMIQATGGFAGAFSALALAIVVSAGCMIKLSREGF